MFWGVSVKQKNTLLPWFLIAQVEQQLKDGGSVQTQVASVEIFYAWDRCGKVDLGIDKETHVSCI